ncbi:flagellar biosynthetic protein FliO [Aquibacillus koreensis]|uniref:Flagellar protein n=1 Tax=Aquibacillus koreensis TaxID=279446 RepID=A0A9X3WKN6_9BACI|nr:flagellar biosynthetic protein FliO [Aquibacillus koreensis]MCT2534534.1 flagellar biosynthetic protein FliO [Aquibacillus koreensis]MDC3421872.1 flagellar biosynthetic protein FliO [Aquibacillus koreensis]
MIKKIVCLFFLSLFLIIINLTPDISHASAMVDEMFKIPEVEKEPTSDPSSDITDEPSGDENQQENPSLGGESVSMPTLIFQLVISLGFVIGLIYLVLKFINSKNKLFQKVSALRNLGGIPLGANKSVQVVKIGERIYVLGVGENVELLSEITDSQTRDELLTQDQGTEIKPQNVIASFINKDNKKQEEKGIQSTNKFQNLFQQELNTLVQGRKKLTDRFKREDNNHE